MSPYRMVGELIVKVVFWGLVLGWVLKSCDYNESRGASRVGNLDDRGAGVAAPVVLTRGVSGRLSEGSFQDRGIAEIRHRSSITD